MSSESPYLTTVLPVSPVAPWLGGKRNLARRICALLDATPCTTYAEPFVGMGGIFLRRTARPRAEVINDFSRGDYGRDLFGREQFQLMAERLARIEGKFLLSLNDLPEVRQVFGAFHLTPVGTSYSIGNHAGRGIDRGELLISNFWKEA